MNINRLRPGQQQAIDTLLRLIGDGKPAVSIVVPTRYGKSNIQRLAAIELVDSRQVCGVFCLTPSTVLASQIVSEPELIEMADLFDVPADRALCCRTGSPYDHDPFGNGEYFVSMTTQMATINRGPFVEQCKLLADKYGRSPAVFIDECHETSTPKPRGELVEALLRSGIQCGLFTALAVRTDGDLIPGFEYKELSVEERSIYKSRPHEDPRLINVDQYDGCQHVYRLVADHETTFKEAWAEDPSPLCKISREVIDVKMEAVGDAMGDVMLSELSATEARRYLGKITRCQEAINLGVHLLLRDLREYRRLNPKCAAMVLTGNDQESDAEDNKHARAVESTIKEMQSEYEMKLKVVTATLKTKEDEAAELIRQFAHCGHGDVLVVKQMGCVGLNVPRAKSLLDLSSVRTPASCVQRWMRVATPYAGINTATIITMADVLTEKIWSACIREEGGEYTSSRFVGELIKTYVKEREQLPVDEYMVDELWLSQLDDNEGAAAAGDSMPYVERLLVGFPQLKGEMTKAEIASKLTSCGLVFSGDSVGIGKQTVSVDAVVKQLRDEIVKASRDIANRQVRYDQDKDEWARRRKIAYSEAKQFAGITDPGVKLEWISNVKTLRRMLEHMKSQLRSVVSN